MLHNAFEQPVHQAQQTFRCLLSAMAEPLLPRPLPVLPPPLPGLMAGSAALLYTLIDQEVSWWSPELPPDTLASLTFHTGTKRAATPDEADFVLVPRGHAMPDLAALKAGSVDYPDRSATLLIEVDDFDTQQVAASGPGIAGVRRFGANGLPRDFWRQWQDNHSRFPQGVDVLLISEQAVAGLPRSTALQEADHVCSR
jgi:alpha-D-ribose 1-methylphosphonate 5-triphosphate synthase subunit PhnH